MGIGGVYCTFALPVLPNQLRLGSRSQRDNCSPCCRLVFDGFHAREFVVFVQAFNDFWPETLPSIVDQSPTIKTSGSVSIKVSTLTSPE